MTDEEFRAQLAAVRAKYGTGEVGLADVSTAALLWEAQRRARRETGRLGIRYSVVVAVTGADRGSTPHTDLVTPTLLRVKQLFPKPQAAVSGTMQIQLAGAPL